jgi:hypothetical protein
LLTRSTEGDTERGSRRGGGVDGNCITPVIGTNPGGDSGAGIGNGIGTIGCDGGAGGAGGCGLCTSSIVDIELASVITWSGAGIDSSRGTCAAGAEGGAGGAGGSGISTDIEGSESSIHVRALHGEGSQGTGEMSKSFGLKSGLSASGGR